MVMHTNLIYGIKWLHLDYSMQNIQVNHYIVPGDLIEDLPDHIAYLTEENCGKYSLDDIVLPLPGSKIM